MKCMLRVIATTAALALAVAGTSYAQEAGGPAAGRWEVSAFPGGGIFFTKGDTAEGSGFGEFALGGSATYNINRWFGVEGEMGVGLGIKQDLDFGGETLGNANVPHSLAYNGDVIYSFLGNDRALAPYVAGGVGGLTLFNRDSLAPIGMTRDETFFTGNTGAGIKWFASARWGVRADYRFFGIRSKDDAPAFFGLNEARYGHRVYGGFILTGGR